MARAKSRDLNSTLATWGPIYTLGKGQEAGWREESKSLILSMFKLDEVYESWKKNILPASELLPMK